METGRHLIEATVLIVLFMRAPAVSFTLLNNLSPEQLLNQPLSWLSCHPVSHTHTRTLYTAALGYVHAFTHIK